MRIGIDCQEMKPNTIGGINTFLFGLLSGLNNCKEKSDTIVLFCSRSNYVFLKNRTKDYNLEYIILNGFNKYVKVIFQSFAIILNSKYLFEKSTNVYNCIFLVNKTINTNCDILYVPTTVLNSFNLKVATLISMHDIQHVHFPEFFSKLRMRIRGLRFFSSAKFTSKIQASSSFIKNDLLSFFKFLNPIDICIITEGVDLQVFNSCTYTSISKEPHEKFIYYPAQLWKHKNHILVLNVLKQIEIEYNIKIELILTGGKQTAARDILQFIELNKMPYVKYLGKVSELKLVELYQTAHFMITASLYESSCLPIIEAAVIGCPILASNIPPNIEMSKNIKMHLFNSNDAKSLKEEMLNCWKNSDYSRESEYNKVQSQSYSWDIIAKEYMEEFKKLCKIKLDYN